LLFFGAEGVSRELGICPAGKLAERFRGLVRLCHACLHSKEFNFRQKDRTERRRKKERKKTNHGISLRPKTIKHPLRAARDVGQRRRWIRRFFFFFFFFFCFFFFFFRWRFVGALVRDWFWLSTGRRRNRPARRGPLRAAAPIELCGQSPERIFLYMVAGPSQVDTLRSKPRLTAEKATVQD